jgi:hypothetical protein
MSVHDMPLKILENERTKKLILLIIVVVLIISSTIIISVVLTYFTSLEDIGGG